MQLIPHLDIPAIERMHDTPLIRASGCGNEALTRLLLHHNSNLHATNDQGQTALIAAVDNGHMGRNGIRSKGAIAY